MKYTNKTEEKINMEMIKTKSKPGRVSYGGKGVAAVISATRVWSRWERLFTMLGFPAKRWKHFFFFTKKKKLTDRCRWILGASVHYQYPQLQSSVLVTNHLFLNYYCQSFVRFIIPDYDLYCFPCVALKFSVALNFRKFHCKRSKTKFVESWLFNTKPFTLLL